ncbi:MAG TPA: ISNCY family transposase [Gammaproteobacteria bacterium]|nr:ISNCY family transposase [Gammaproteobacteria bacterium]
MQEWTLVEELISLSLKELDKLSVIERVERGELTQVDAGLMINRSTRQIRRLLVRYRQQGEQGLISCRRGKPGNNRLSNTRREEIATIIASQYEDFGPTLANEMLAERHNIHVSTETVRQLMTDRGIWRAKVRRGANAHPMRERRSKRGELIQIDGSPHAWFEDRGPKCTLIVFIDDATSELMGLQFWPQETTESYMSTLRQYLHDHGRPVSIYSDRHGIFRPVVDTEKPGLTQFGRALGALDIESIQANSPQAKGRVERVNRTLQDRLVKEMRLNGISTLAAGNAFLHEFVERFNARFAKPALIAVDAHRELMHTTTELDLMMSFQSQRKISKNLEVRYNNQVYQLAAVERRRRLTGTQATICEHYDGRVNILANGEQMTYKVFKRGEQPKPVEDEKTLNHRVDQAVQQQSPKPKATHPWKKIPATPGGYSHRA